MELRHPLGAPVSPGARLRYWIVSERHGRLGGIGFRAARWLRAGETSGRRGPKRRLWVRPLAAD